MPNRWQQRLSPKRSLDPYPTPPWATRALFLYALKDGLWPLDLGHDPTVHEPGCGAGHMVRTIREFTDRVSASDILAYGFPGASTLDYLDPGTAFPRVDWTITNPPYSQAQGFIERALGLSDFGVAMLLRTTFLEGIRRYETLFSSRPPRIVAQFTQRVTMERGRLRENAGSMIPYAWFVWLKRPVGPEGRHYEWGREGPRILWIPPCREELTEPGDFTDPRKA